MAKRRGKQDVGAKQEALPFDYSPAEWSNIEEPIRAIGQSLPNEVREALVKSARRYRARAHVRMQPWPKERRDWQRIVQLSERLHQLVSVRVQGVVDYWNISGAPENAERLRRTLKDPLKGILQIKLVAKDILDHASKTDHRPAQIFQSYVLTIWTHLGGKLQSARHPATHKPQGPLIRFLRAVTIPVMGASAPSLESLPAIIRRRKRAEGISLTEGCGRTQKANGHSR
jgi:hypothetical protein